MSSLTVAGRSLQELPSYAADPASIEVTHLSDEEAAKIVADALEAAGCSEAELEEQAANGEFTSELARRMWFLVSSFSRRETT